MRHFRFRYQVNGGHTTVRVFIGKDATLTHGNCGTLTMTNEDWNDFRGTLELGSNPDFVDPAASVEIVEEG